MTWGSFVRILQDKKQPQQINTRSPFFLIKHVGIYYLRKTNLHSVQLQSTTAVWLAFSYFQVHIFNIFRKPLQSSVESVTLYWLAPICNVHNVRLLFYQHSVIGSSYWANVPPWTRRSEFCCGGKCLGIINVIYNPSCGKEEYANIQPMIEIFY